MQLRQNGHADEISSVYLDRAVMDLAEMSGNDIGRERQGTLKADRPLL